MGSRARHSSSGCSRQNVQVRHPPVWVVEKVKSLNPELEQVAFLVWHTELLVYFGIELDNPRTPDRVAPGIAELPGRSLDKGIQIQPSGGSGIVEIGAGSGRV